MNKLNNSRILVTGGAGFIGSHLVDALIDEGCNNLRVLDDLSNGKIKNIEHHQNNPSFEFIEGSVLKESDVTKSLTGIDFVFHLACLGVRHSIKSPFENHRVNAEGTLIVLKHAFEKKIKKFIYCSSSEIYGTAQNVPMTEDHPTHPKTIYGASKLAGEKYTLAYFQTYGFNTTVLRPFNVYGPRSHYEGDAGELIPKSIVRALNNEPILIFGDGSQTRDFTYVEDAVQGLITLAKFENSAGKVFHQGSNFEISIQDVAKQILKIADQSQSQITNIEDRPGDVLRLYANSNCFEQATGWKPKISFLKGLTQTIQWFQNQEKDPSSFLKEEKGKNWV